MVCRYSKSRNFRDPSEKDKMYKNKIKRDNLKTSMIPLVEVRLTYSSAGLGNPNGAKGQQNLAFTTGIATTHCSGVRGQIEKYFVICKKN